MSGSASKRLQMGYHLPSCATIKAESRFLTKLLAQLLIVQIFIKAICTASLPIANRQLDTAVRFNEESNGTTAKFLCEFVNGYFIAHCFFFSLLLVFMCHV